MLRELQSLLNMIIGGGVRSSRFKGVVPQSCQVDLNLISWVCRRTPPLDPFPNFFSGSPAGRDAEASIMGWEDAGDIGGGFAIHIPLALSGNRYV